MRCIFGRSCLSRHFAWKILKILRRNWQTAQECEGERLLNHRKRILRTWTEKREKGQSESKSRGRRRRGKVEYPNIYWQKMQILNYSFGAPESLVQWMWRERLTTWMWRERNTNIQLHNYTHINFIRYNNFVYKYSQPYSRPQSQCTSIATQCRSSFGAPGECYVAWDEY